MQRSQLAFFGLLLGIESQLRTSAPALQRAQPQNTSITRPACTYFRATSRRCWVADTSMWTYRQPFICCAVKIVPESARAATWRALKAGAAWNGALHNISCVKQLRPLVEAIGHDIAFCFLSGGSLTRSSGLILDLGIGPLRPSMTNVRWQSRALGFPIVAKRRHNSQNSIFHTRLRLQCAPQSQHASASSFVPGVPGRQTLVEALLGSELTV